MNVLVTLNSNYLNQLVVMLTSLTQSNPGIHFTVYIAHTSMTEGDFKFINRHVDSENCTIVEMRIDDNLFHDAPITKRYPKDADDILFPKRLSDKLPQSQ